MIAPPKNVIGPGPTLLDLVLPDLFLVLPRLDVEDLVEADRFRLAWLPDGRLRGGEVVRVAMAKA